MILRKKNITILISIIILVICMLIGIIGFLYLNTDMFKSNETLFAKYFVQNFDAIEILKSEDVLGIEKILSENKYVSKLEGNIEYTENIGTSDENRNNPINNINIEINSNIDKLTNYTYSDIAIKNSEDNLVKFEYLNEEQNYGIRLKGIQQFVSVDATTDEEILQSIKLENLESLTSEIDISSIFDLSEDEKQKLIDTYIGIVQTKISSDKYYKQGNSLITVNDKDIQTNSYYIKITIEEYNDLIIDILTQITQDEIILSRVDLIENEIKEKYVDYNPDENLRNQFINIINDKINEIQDNNIGSDEVRITVYENNEKTVRTSIEKNTDKTTIDFYDLSISINKTELSNIEKETFIQIQKDELNNMLVEYGIIQNNEVVSNFKYKYVQTLQENDISKKIDIEISNEKNKCVINIGNNIEVVQDFSNQITLETDNVKLSDLNEETLDIVMEIVMENVETQLTNLESVVNLEDCMNILQNLGYIENEASIELPTEGVVSDIEKKRFNSQFEFFVSKNLTTDNIKELTSVAENNFEDMKVLLKTGEIEDLDIEKLNSGEENIQYNKNISEILIFIKSNTSNDKKKEDVIDFLEYDTDNKYNVLLQYDDNGLVRLIRIQIQGEE